MNIKIWDPVTDISKNSTGRHLLKSICDLMQFVVYTITTETHVECLANHFMKNVVLLFSMVTIIVVSAGSWFNIVFKDMCAALGIIYWTFAHGNNKVMSVKKNHRFLNKMQEISGQDRDTHEVFLQNSKTSPYACNSAPIYATDIIRSVAAVG